MDGTVRVISSLLLKNLHISSLMYHFLAKYTYEVKELMEDINEVRKDEQLVIPDTIDYMR